MRVYYNECDEFAAAWLQQLMDAGLISPGRIDDRSIANLGPDDVAGYDRVHLFAGIAGWELALNLAGWGERPAWTGSCPCQPFSAAGKQAGGADPRHLWPEWFRLIRECRPPVLFGEQVAAAIGHGWLDAVFTDLEGEGYSCGAAVLGAHSVGAPHIRQRLWFVADAQRGSAERLGADAAGPVAAAGAVGELGHSAGTRQSRRVQKSHEVRERPITASGVGHPSDRGRGEDRGSSSRAPWSDIRWLPCRDGKARPVPLESCVQFVVDGLPDQLVPSGDPSRAFPQAGSVPNRRDLLRGAGNAIVPEVAAAFVRSYSALCPHGAP